MSLHFFLSGWQLWHGGSYTRTLYMFIIMGSPPQVVTWLTTLKNTVISIVHISKIDTDDIITVDNCLYAFHWINFVTLTVVYEVTWFWE